jgi:hypothetical protein
MPRGAKDKYTEPQKRKAEHIEDSYEARGVAPEEAEARAWATVNKQSGGGEKKGGSGQRKSPVAKREARKDSAQRAVATKAGHSPNKGAARGKSSSDKTELQALNKDELLQRASAKGITGRSRMRKQELIDALNAA